MDKTLDELSEAFKHPKKDTVNEASEDRYNSYASKCPAGDQECRLQEVVRMNVPTSDYSFSRAEWNDAVYREGEGQSDCKGFSDCVRRFPTSVNIEDRRTNVVPGQTDDALDSSSY